MRETIRQTASREAHSSHNHSHSHIVPFLGTVAVILIIAVMFIMRQKFDFMRKKNGIGGDRFVGRDGERVRVKISRDKNSHLAKLMGEQPASVSAAEIEPASSASDGWVTTLKKKVGIKTTLDILRARFAEFIDYSRRGKRR